MDSDVVVVGVAIELAPDSVGKPVDNGIVSQCP